MKTDIVEIVGITATHKMSFGYFKEGCVEEALAWFKKEYPTTNFVVNPPLQINQLIDRDCNVFEIMEE